MCIMRSVQTTEFLLSILKRSLSVTIYPSPCRLITNKFLSLIKVPRIMKFKISLEIKNYDKSAAYIIQKISR